MTYEEAKAKVAELKKKFDNPFSEADKRQITELYYEVLRKELMPTTCQQCYHDALIEVYLFLKKNKTMRQKCNYRLRAGYIISCPDFYNGKIFTNENLTDKVAKEYLERYPNQEGYFSEVPDDDKIENKIDSKGNIKKQKNDSNEDIE